MELNTQIWGDSTEWTKITAWNVDDCPYAIYRSNKHGNGTFGDFVTTNVFEYGTEPDNSYIYAGQAAGITPWGDRAILWLPNDWTYSGGATWKDDIVVEHYEDTASIGYYFRLKNDWTGNDIAAMTTLTTGDSTSLNNTRNTRWLAEGGYGEGFPNYNKDLKPIVDFNPRFTYGVIYILYYDTQEQSFNTTTLYDFKTNYGGNSRYRIEQAYLQLTRCTEYSTNSSTYEYTNVGTYNYSVCCVDTTVKNVGNTEYLHFNNCGSNTNSILPLAGCFSNDWQNDNTYGYGFSFDSYPLPEYADYYSHGLVLYSYNKITNRALRWNTDTDSRHFEYYYYMENTVENIEYIYKAAAAYGLFFTDGKTDLMSNHNRWTHEDMCLGLLRDGVGYGDYTHGAGNIDNPAYNWTSSHNSGYVPDAEHDPNTYSNTTVFNPVLDLHSMTKRYVLDGAAVDQLGRDLWKISSDLASADPSDMFKNYEDLLIDNFLTNDPIKCIVSLDKYPITDIPTGNEKEPIRYGKVTGTAQGRPFDKTSYQFTFQSVSIYPRFGKSFLDYEPYTHYELYIPFCGVAQIDPGDIMGKRLSVIEVLDFSTGAVTAYILANELVINSLTGTCNINIPVTGTDGITLNAQINNGILNMKRSQGNAFLGSILSTFTLGGLIKAGSDPAGAANKFMQGQLDVAQSSYELQHTQVPMHTIGAASAVGSWTIELNCRLLIYYPTGEAITDDVPPSLANLSEYAHTTGFACVLQGKVRDFTGLTVGNIVLDGVNATEEEKKMIQALFSQGVYL